MNTERFNKEKYQELSASLQEREVLIVAVSKTKPLALLKEAYNAGVRDFGENRVQELLEKIVEMPTDIRWHLIGHLQTNKVKHIVGKVFLIQSIDSKKLLEEVDRQAKKTGIIQKVLLQFHIALEESKFGFNEEEAVEMLSDAFFRRLDNISICGVMGMATLTEESERIRSEFRHLNKIYQRLKKEFFSNKSEFEHISMGMSGDLRIAIEEGSTIIRPGSLLFGSR